MSFGDRKHRGKGTPEGPRTERLHRQTGRTFGSHRGHRTPERSGLRERTTDTFERIDVPAATDVRRDSKGHCHSRTVPTPTPGTRGPDPRTSRRRPLFVLISKDVYESLLRSSPSLSSSPSPPVSSWCPRFTGSVHGPLGVPGRRSLVCRLWVRGRVPFYLPRRRNPD